MILVVAINVRVMEQGEIIVPVVAINVRVMEQGEIIVPALIVLAVGIFVGSRIWIMFRK
jgi:hypothetical protein